MRELTDHVVKGNQSHELKIEAVDGPGVGNANHLYRITGFDPTNNPSDLEVDEDDTPKTWILFQNGPIKEVGVNGITNEALLAIVIDRLRGFQNGPYPCQETETALFHAQESLASLRNRTRERLARGVEGMHQV